MPRDVVVRRGKIAALLPVGRRCEATRTIDATGLVVLPGAIDAHVHFDDPGRESWEGWASGSLAAAAGGVTTVMDMPIDSDPPTNTAQALRAKRDAATGRSIVDFALWGGLVDSDPDRLRGLLEAGAVGFKAFLCDSGWEDFPRVNLATLEAACRIIGSSGLVVGVHCESEELLLPSGPLHLRRPESSELDAVGSVVEIARRSRARVHLVHLSSARAVALAQGLPNVTIETCPHYLALNQDDVLRIGPNAYCAPPIRDEANRELLWRAIIEREIDAIGSDHSPCPSAMKSAPDPFLGIAGVETTLSVLLGEDRCDLTRISELRTAAARIFGLAGKGRIARGYDADLVIVDPDRRWTAHPERLHSRGQNSPYLGRLLTGEVRTTIVRGVVVFDGGESIGAPQGQFCRPNRRDGRDHLAMRPKGVQR